MNLCDSLTKRVDLFTSIQFFNFSRIFNVFDRFLKAQSLSFDSIHLMLQIVSSFGVDGVFLGTDTALLPGQHSLFLFGMKAFLDGIGAKDKKNVFLSSQLKHMLKLNNKENFFSHNKTITQHFSLSPLEEKYMHPFPADDDLGQINLFLFYGVTTNSSKLTEENIKDVH